MLSKRKVNKVLMTALCLCVFTVSHRIADAQVSRPATEAEALTAIKIATNPTLKLTAAEDFVAAFPNSNARLSIAELIAAEILAIKNGPVALALLDRALAVFTSEQEREIFKSVAFEVNVLGKKWDQAFALAAELLAKDPENLKVLIEIINFGTDLSAQSKHEFVKLSLQYGLKAIAIIEAGTKPASVDDERWTAYKNSLGLVYRNTASLYRLLGNKQQARASALKGSQLMPHEPSTFLVLGWTISDEYHSLLVKYEAMPEGEAKRATGRQVNALLDEVIDAFARSVALATGHPRYQDLVQRLVPRLTSYYKTRHNNSTEGLQELLNRYRSRP